MIAFEPLKRDHSESSLSRVLIAGPTIEKGGPGFCLTHGVVGRFMEAVPVSQDPCPRFDERMRLERLRIFGLSKEDLVLGERMHIFLEQHSDSIVAEFYQFVSSDERMRSFISEPQTISRLKCTMQRYLGELALDFDSPKYFESRLQVGIVHRRIGLPLSVYYAAYSYLQTVILQKIGQVDGYDDVLLRFMSFTNRIVWLDMSLATEAYNASEIQCLEKELTVLREEEGRLRKVAQTDSLTGVARRGHLMAILRRRLEQAKREGTCVAVLMVDIDHFKKVNDQYGHLIGDHVLRCVAERIRASLRDEDVVGRYGGEEFLLILETNELNAGIDVAERIRKTICDSPMRVNHQNLEISVSVGMAQSLQDEWTEQVIQRADEALYEAKRSGRNRVVVANQGSAEAA